MKSVEVFFSRFIQKIEQNKRDISLILSHKIQKIINVLGK